MNTIYIDLDGPILDTSQRHYEVYSDILRKYGDKPLPHKKYWDLKRDITPLNEILSLTKSIRILENFKEEWIKKIENSKFLKYDKLQPKSKEALKRLHGNRLVLVTLRQDKSKLRQQLKEFGIEEFFEKIMNENSSNTAWKQKADMIKKDKSSNGIVVGDTEADILAGKYLKIPIISVTNGIRNSTKLKKFKPELIVRSLYDSVPLILNSKFGL